MSMYSQTVYDLRKSERKTEGYKGEWDQNLAFNLVILVRIPPNFLSKSRVLHLVCTPTGVYSRKGGPVVLIFAFLNYIYVDNYEWRWILCLCSTQEFSFQKICLRDLAGLPEIE